jgi:hypothetical protein
MAHGPLVYCHGVLDQVKKYLFSKIVLIMFSFSVHCKEVLYLL